MPIYSKQLLEIEWREKSGMFHLELFVVNKIFILEQSGPGVILIVICTTCMD